MSSFNFSFLPPVASLAQWTVELIILGMSQKDARLGHVFPYVTFTCPDWVFLLSWLQSDFCGIVIAVSSVDSTRCLLAQTWASIAEMNKAMPMIRELVGPRWGGHVVWSWARQTWPWVVSRQIEGPRWKYVTGPGAKSSIQFCRGWHLATVSLDSSSPFLWDYSDDFQNFFFKLHPSWRSETSEKVDLFSARSLKMKYWPHPR